MSISCQQLRIHAISQSLFPKTTLKAAIEQLGFVQADPIRSPATAQDLILRHRVRNYRAGDLERRYESLGIEEDILYAYGFVASKIWRLLQPRKITGLSKLETAVLKTVLAAGEMHPKELEQHFGRKRQINAWGSYSKASTMALEGLHFRGLLRVARREKGIRVYEPASENSKALTLQEKSRELIMAIASILAPVSLKSLRETLSRLRLPASEPGRIKQELEVLARTGELRLEDIEGVTYLWPETSMRPVEVPRTVKFLAPFDPLIWDRRRFEHFWNWSYRFEAYTPAAKRVRGYYAMPLLWGDEIIGWANAVKNGKRLDVELGFVNNCPVESEFSAQLEAEIGRMELFLKASEADRP